MLVSIKLENNISCDYICQKLQKAITEYQKTNDTSDSILVIDIQKIYDNVNLIPKIELQDSPP